MEYPKLFICAATAYTTYRHFVPAPWFRKTFFADADCRLRVTGLGFYRVWINGTEITNGNFLDTGILGARVILHVLNSFGESELAWTMITRKEFPSYGALIGFGETTLPEFFRRPGEGVYSHNHHMFGDIKNWFISAVAGLRYNPTGNDHRHVLIQPAFLGALTFAEASYTSPFGNVFVRWDRTDGGVELHVCTPGGMTAEIVLPDGTRFSHTGDRVYPCRTV